MKVMAAAIKIKNLTQKFSSVVLDPIHTGLSIVDSEIDG